MGNIKYKGGFMKTFKILSLFLMLSTVGLIQAMDSPKKTDKQNTNKGYLLTSICSGAVSAVAGAFSVRGFRRFYGEAGSLSYLAHLARKYPSYSDILSICSVLGAISIISGFIAYRARKAYIDPKQENVAKLKRQGVISTVALGFLGLGACYYQNFLRPAAPIQAPIQMMGGLGFGWV